MFFAEVLCQPLVLRNRQQSLGIQSSRRSSAVVAKLTQFAPNSSIDRIFPHKYIAFLLEIRKKLAKKTKLR